MFRLLSILLLTLALGACQTDERGADGDAVAHGGSWQSISQEGQGEIRVLYVPARGWAWRGEDEEGQLSGVTVTLMRDFVRWVGETHDVRLGIEFEEEQDWSRFYRRVVNSEEGVFGIGNVTITEERREELAFSPPYVYNVAVLITVDEVSELSEMANSDQVFSDLRGLGFAGTLHEERLERLKERSMPDLAIDLAESNDEILERVAEGGHFAWIDAYNFVRAREEGMPLRRHPVGDDPGEAFGVIMPHGSDWEALMEEYFQNAHGGLLQSDFWQQTLEDYLGSEVSALLMAAAEESKTQ
ncbi:transporter substrate-binding domain-containing protein [Gammaproteobacteria bacterium AB-CW1]|uniref:Transporter substrate-binding domain-containing protein n=1 Tax=Natronospira elongata TaxID=3110268 RepID=A0AAP6MKP8_9GAMM|nr:transporter substrate-binding domain-containing protein [Gammaproteobacteria bacterium AB-CW1]